MTMLAEVVDAVIGGDTHRDTHALEMLAPNGTTIAVLAISNDDDGFAGAIAWIAENAPGPRVVVGLEGTRSYGIGLARAVAAAGLIVVEVQAPRRADRRHRGNARSGMERARRGRRLHPRRQRRRDARQRDANGRSGCHGL